MDWLILYLWLPGNSWCIQIWLLPSGPVLDLAESNWCIVSKHIDRHKGGWEHNTQRDRQWQKQNQEHRPNWNPVFSNGHIRRCPLLLILCKQTEPLSSRVRLIRDVMFACVIAYKKLAIILQTASITPVCNPVWICKCWCEKQEKNNGAGKVVVSEITVAHKLCLTTSKT